MRELLMVRYGEIFLKGQNRPVFQRMLLERVRKAARPYSGQVRLSDNRLMISDVTDMPALIQAVTKVFGVHSVCPAIQMPKDDVEAVLDQAAQMMAHLEGSFKVAARRADKLYPFDSPRLNAMAGERILREHPHLKVDVHQPDHTLSLEIRDQAYLYVDVIKGPGGMPVGSNGKAALLLSGGIDSPVAGYMIAKRGVSLCAVHFYSFPYTGERSKQKVLDLARILSSYTGGMKVFVVPFTDIQMKIHELCPEDHTTLIMRRFMMRIAQIIAMNEGAQALITGESIGQVASQTMEALACTNAVVDLPVFRPLIGFDKVDIIEIARAIDSYETSCLPYEDCCTVFTPRHPVTRPKLDRVEKAEKLIPDQEALIQAAVQGAEVITL